MKVTETLANFVADTDFEDIPSTAVEHAKLCILDWLGAALAGSIEEPAKIVFSIIKELGGREESTVVGTDIKTSCINAALANGVSGHAVELDDIHEEAIIHPAAPVLPAALAIAEREGASGSDLITAIVLGYEVEIRIGMALNPAHYKFWHTTGTCGTFGAAAAAGKILGLNGEEMVNAFGIAGTMAAGLIEVFGTMSKPLNPGRAAMDGVMAALLAKRGFTSSSAILEAEKGYCRATSEEVDYGKLTEGLGERFEIVNNIFKLHASCGHTHGAIDAMLHIVEKYKVKPSDVDEILVATYPIAVEVVGKNYEPRTASEAKFSLPYCVATALIHGRVGLKEFSEEKLKDQAVVELSKRVKVVVDPKLIDARLGCAKVALRTKSGEEYAYRVDVPRGYPKNPLTKLELEEKFKALASLVLPEERVREIVGLVTKLDEVNEIKSLTALIAK